LLWINLVTDCFPALALGMEKPEPDIMGQKPRRARDGIFAGGMGIDCLYQGVFVTAITLAAYFIGEFLQNGAWKFSGIAEEHGAEGMTMAFLAMSMAEIFHSFNMRSQRGSIFTMARRSGENWWLWGSFVISLALTGAVVFVPFMQKAFGFAGTFTFEEYLIAMALALTIIPLVEIVKFFQRMAAKNKRGR
ncbi:MAG: cation transporting ATPase C-terminal domain-containing protein, partial [Oscillospiraceae bacterium]|nr:cation transporting ATPase C-terminal domain-containing protein [Oscillospiraceae bacterium]